MLRTGPKMEVLRWIFVVVFCLSASDFALGQCPSANENCNCLQQEAVIRVYQCDNLGDVAGLPYLGTTDDIIQVIQISSSTVHNIYNNSFPGLKTRTLDIRSIGIERLEANAFAGLENYIENLYLAGNEIQVVPLGTFSSMVHLRTLTLDRNSITTIENDQFKGLQRLTHLGLESNNIASLSENAFNGMPNLKYLYLQHNLIQQLPVGVFDNTGNIHELNLLDNRISGLHPDVFSKMPLIEVLYISSNRIQSLPEAVFDENRNLKTIDLDDNRISSNLSNRYFVGPRNVEIIDFSFNNLTYFHPSTFHNLKKLRKLFIDNNKFKKLAPSAFEGLDNIQELYLHQNLITALPTNSFIGMPNLKLLDLSRNQIKRLGFGIFDPFGHLEHLDISRNEIESIEHGPFITLRSLEILDVSWNKVPIVKNDWFAQENWESSDKPLKELYLNNNGIKHIDLETFWPLKNLEKLDISANRIFTLNETVFKTLTSLTEIGIHSNPLHNISKGLFSNLNQIKVLDVSETCLTEIVPFSFDGMAALEKLDLSGGFINAIYSESFSGTGPISILDIGNNNITALEHPVLSPLGNSLEVLHLNHNALTMEGLGNNLDPASSLKVLDISFNNLENIYGVANLQQLGVLLKIMANPIHCDCNASWLGNYETLADFENVRCETPEHLNNEAAVCFKFPQECSQDPIAQMYINYCANQPDAPIQEIDNSSNANGTDVAESNRNVKTFDDYKAYCIEPEIPSTTPKPDDGGDEELEPLPNPLDIHVDVEDRTDVFVTWQYQNNSRILGYKLTCREFAEDDNEIEKIIINLKRTNYTFENLNLGSNYIICVGIILDDDSILTDSRSCKEISLFAVTTKPPYAITPAKIGEDDAFPIMPVIGTCIGVVILLVIILVIVIVCLKRKPKKDEDKYMDERLRDKMGMWVNSFNYSGGGVNEQIAEQTTVEVDIFAPVDVAKKKKDNRKSNGHVAT